MNFLEESRPLFSIASASLGSHFYHDLPKKARIASELGYDGMEVMIPEFEAFVDEVRTGLHSALFPPAFSPSTASDSEFEIRCAQALASFCSSHSLQITCFQPLRGFENFTSPEDLQKHLDEAERWLALMPHLHTNLMLVCSNLLESDPVADGRKTVQEYLEELKAAFRLLGHKAEKYGVRIGYEPLAWGSVINRWEQVWEVVRDVDMPNVGIIFDSFNSLGRQYADPSLPSGILPLPFSTLEANLVELSLTVPGDKVFFYQVEDASKPSSPIFSKPMAPARMTWSRSSRLFPCEEGGFLPVARFTEALVRTGYKGWWSAEMFNVSLFDEDPECTRKHGVRGLAGMRKLWKEVAEGADKSKGQVSDETNVEAEGGNTHEAYWGSVSIPATVAAF